MLFLFRLISPPYFWLFSLLFFFWIWQIKQREKARGKKPNSKNTESMIIYERRVFYPVVWWDMESSETKIWLQSNPSIDFFSLTFSCSLRIFSGYYFRKNKKYVSIMKVCFLFFFYRYRSPLPSPPSNNNDKHPFSEGEWILLIFPPPKNNLFPYIFLLFLPHSVLWILPYSKNKQTKQWNQICNNMITLFFQNLQAFFIEIQSSFYIW